jgi:hypothetical protein
VDLGVLEAPALVGLFSESPAILFEVPPERAARLFQAARERQLLAWPLGTVAAHGMLRALVPGQAPIEWTVAEMRATAARPLAALWNEEVDG